MGVDTGYVYSIDAATGCLYWTYKAAAPVRTAISVGPGKRYGTFCGKPPVAFAQQNLHRGITTVTAVSGEGHGEVELAVAAEVTHS